MDAILSERRTNVLIYGIFVRQLLVYIMLAFVQVLLAGMAVLSKIAISSIPPVLFSSMRAVIATPLLFSIARLLDDTMTIDISPSLGIKLILLGLTGVVGNQVFNIYGLYFTNPTIQAIIQPSIPIFTMILSVFFLKEPISLLKIAGIIFGVLGAVIVVCSNGFDNNTAFVELTFGVALLLLNAVFMALYYVIQKPVLSHMKAAAVTFYTYFFGGITLFVISLYYYLTVDWTSYDKMVWIALVYSGVVATAIGYLLNSIAMHYASPTYVAIFTVVQPVAAAILSWLFLGEALNIFEAVGGVFIALGLSAVIFSRAVENWRFERKRKVIEGEEGAENPPEFLNEGVESGERSQLVRWVSSFLHKLNSRFKVSLL